MTIPARPPSAQRSLSRSHGRNRNLERRVIPQPIPPDDVQFEPRFVWVSSADVALVDGDAKYDGTTGYHVDWTAGTTQIATNDIDGTVNSSPGTAWTGANFEVDFATDPTKVWIRKAGMYLFRASFRVGAATSETFSLSIYEDGNTFEWGESATPQFSIATIDGVFLNNREVQRVTPFYLGADSVTAWRGVAVRHNNSSASATCAVEMMVARLSPTPAS